MIKDEKINTVRFSHSRRKFIYSSIVGAISLPLVGADSRKEDEGDYNLFYQDITIRNLPEPFKGFTIGMISDVHSCIFMNKEDMDKYVQAMNALKTDLIVVTGDFVNSKTEEVYPFAEAFSNLKAPFGVYGCLGNHDYFANDVERVIREVDNCGVKILRNDAVQITKSGHYLNLLGTDEIGRGTDPNDYFDKTLSPVTNDRPKILLCHKPYFFDNARKRNVDLVLSGHTHGGQIVFGVIDNIPISLASLFSKYVAGLYTLGSSQMYVNRGIGTVGLPFRINCPPELTVITLS